MAGKKNCKPEEYQHLSEERCCDKCPKGQHVFKDCTQTEQTMCERCKHNEYTADRNFLRQCLPCRDPCHSKSNMKTSRECQADQDRQCECVSGYYFVDKDKTHCATVTECDPGSEVKVNATIGNDTVCAPCMPGTFSSTKGLSPCKPHSNCEKLGQELKSAGTDTSDAKCHLIIPSCSWMLPAGLWVGVVVTSIFIILFCIIYWRMKRQSYHTAAPSPCRLSVEPVVIREPLCPCPELGKHCQETCDGQKSLKPVFVNSGKSPVLNLCHQHCDIESDGSSRIPLVDRSSQSVNDMNGHSTISLVRMTSEPQEDEWGGT